MTNQIALWASGHAIPLVLLGLGATLITSQTLDITQTGESLMREAIEAAAASDAEAARVKKKALEDLWKSADEQSANTDAFFDKLQQHFKPK